jgi:putative intracellular protease/amidase
MMLVAIPLFPRFTALDAVGPYEVLQRIPSFDVVFVGHRRGEVRTENGMLGVTCDATFDEVVTLMWWWFPAVSAPASGFTTTPSALGCSQYTRTPS